MRIIGYRPANSWIERQLDERWTRFLTWCAGGGVVVAAVLGTFVAPHQAVVRMRYAIAQLTAEVERLERQERALLLERERLTAVPVLAQQAAALGLAPVPPERIEFLAPNGVLVAMVPPQGNQPSPEEPR